MKMDSFDFDPDELLLNLSKINKLLSRDDSEMLIRNYQQWKTQRVSSIKILKSIYKDLDNVKLMTDIGRATGTTVGILGGLTAMIGFGLSLHPSTRDVGDKIVKCGAGVGAIGGSAAVLSAGLNCYISERKLTEAKTILKKDRDLTQKLFPLLEQSKILDDLFKEVFGCSILSDAINGVFYIISKIQVICEEGSHTFQDIAEIVCASINNRIDQVKETRSIYLNDLRNDMHGLSDKVKFILHEFCLNERVRASVQSIYNCCKKSTLAFELSKVYFKTWSEITNIQSLNLFLGLFHVAKSSMYHAGVTLANLAFGVIKLGIDIVALISIAEDIKERKSEYAEMLRKIEVLLSLEMRKMTVLYDAVNEMC